MFQMFFSKRSLPNVVATELYAKKCEKTNIRDVFKLKQQPNLAKFNRRKALLPKSKQGSFVRGSCSHRDKRIKPICNHILVDNTQKDNHQAR